MQYKTLMALQLCDDALSNLKPVAAMAKQLDAHLDVKILSALLPLPTLIVSENPNYAWSESLSDLTRKCKDQARQISDLLEADDIEFTTDIEAQQVGQVGKTVARPALTTDLVILNRTSNLLEGAMAQALHGALFSASKPVLVLGDQTEPIVSKPKRVMIAWDGSKEAASAVHHGLGFLKCADVVQAFYVEDSDPLDAKQSLKALARHLSHHDVTIEYRSVAPNGRTTSHALVDHVNENMPDLLIMGAYGHTRFHELVFSGATRAALRQVKSTMLLAH